MITIERKKELKEMVEEQAFRGEVYKTLTMEEGYYMHEQAKKMSSQFAADDKEGAKFKLKADFFYSLIIEKIKGLDAFYVLYFAPTNMPFACCHPETLDDMAQLYTTEDKITAAVKKLQEEKIPVRAVKVENKQYLSFFSTMFYIGINALLINPDEESILMQIDKICNRPDWEHMENKAAAVANPGFQLTSMYFMQELRKPGDLKDKKEIPPLENELMAHLVRGTYLVPIAETPSKDAPLQIPFLQNKDKEVFLPAFTDLNEFRKYNPKMKYNAAIFPFGKLSGFVTENIKGLVVNPMSNNIILPKEQLQRIIRQYQ